MVLQLSAASNIYQDFWIMLHSYISTCSLPPTSVPMSIFRLIHSSSIQDDNVIFWTVLTWSLPLSSVDSNGAISCHTQNIPFLYPLFGTLFSFAKVYILKKALHNKLTPVPMPLHSGNSRIMSRPTLFIHETSAWQGAFRWTFL